MDDDNGNKIYDNDLVSIKGSGREIISGVFFNENGACIKDEDGMFVRLNAFRGNKIRIPITLVITENE